MPDGEIFIPIPSTKKTIGNMMTKKVTKSLVKFLLETPKIKSDVEYLLRYFVEKKKDSDVNMVYEEDIDESEVYEDYYKNVFMTQRTDVFITQSAKTVNMSYTFYT